ncbi:hypothetical protein D3C83_253950 [compost metagenome]
MPCRSSYVKRASTVDLETAGRLIVCRDYYCVIVRGSVADVNMVARRRRDVGGRSGMAYI